MAFRNMNESSNSHFDSVISNHLYCKTSDDRGVKLCHLWRHFHYHVKRALEMAEF